MRYGTVKRVNADDCFGGVDRQSVPVTVYFMVDRSVLFEFMDAIRPISRNARREPIEAILGYSAKLGMEVDE